MRMRPAELWSLRENSGRLWYQAAIVLSETGAALSVCVCKQITPVIQPQLTKGALLHFIFPLDVGENA